MKQIANLQEQSAILTNARFGRKTEKTSEMIEGQLALDLGDTANLFNEIEFLFDEEPEKSDEDRSREAREAVVLLWFPGVGGMRKGSLAISSKPILRTRLEHLLLREITRLP
ncbi:MAG: hypothetical protein E7280_06740 [Lachnospiraceae bacterium]|nr:hypothetical protein [Lachnospiraceae bacterium]